MLLIGYFFVVVIKHMTKNNLQKDEFIWAYDSHGIRVHHDKKKNHSSRQTWQLKQETERSHLNHKLEASQ